jgi:hypothetical protein
MKAVQSFFLTAPDLEPEDEEDFEEALELPLDAVLRGALMVRGAELLDEGDREMDDRPEEDGAGLEEPALEIFEEELAFGARLVVKVELDVLGLERMAFCWVRLLVELFPDDPDGDTTEEERGA